MQAGDVFHFTSVLRQPVFDASERADETSRILTQDADRKWSDPAGAMERRGAAGSCLGLAEGATAFANPNIART